MWSFLEAVQSETDVLAGSWRAQLDAQAGKPRAIAAGRVGGLPLDLI